MQAVVVSKCVCEREKERERSLERAREREKRERDGGGWGGGGQRRETMIDIWTKRQKEREKERERERSTCTSMIDAGAFVCGRGLCLCNYVRRIRDNSEQWICEDVTLSDSRARYFRCVPDGV